MRRLLILLTALRSCRCSRHVGEMFTGWMETMMACRVSRSVINSDAKASRPALASRLFISLDTRSRSTGAP
jgi:hypothetical protein